MCDAPPGPVVVFVPPCPGVRALPQQRRGTRLANLVHRNEEGEHLVQNVGMGLLISPRGIRLNSARTTGRATEEIGGLGQLHLDSIGAQERIETREKRGLVNSANEGRPRRCALPEDRAQLGLFEEGLGTGGRLREVSKAIDGRKIPRQRFVKVRRKDVVDGRVGEWLVAKRALFEAHHRRHQGAIAIGARTSASARIFTCRSTRP